MNFSDVRMPAHFSGIVRLFPLPNLVLFPGVVQALHIFESRYRKMTRDILAADQLVSLCLYRNNPTDLLVDRVPAIFEFGCIGKVIAHKEMPDGRYNLMVVGLKRARIVRELPVDQPYRMAEVDVVDDVASKNSEMTRQLRSDLLKTCQSMSLPVSMAQHPEMQRLINSDLTLGQLVDLIGFTADLDCQDRQRILELSDVDQRCRTLIELLQATISKSNEPGPGFPPDFSIN